LCLDRGIDDSVLGDLRLLPGQRQICRQCRQEFRAGQLKKSFWLTTLPLTIASSCCSRERSCNWGHSDRSNHRVAADVNLRLEFAWAASMARRVPRKIEPPPASTSLVQIGARAGKAESVPVPPLPPEPPIPFLLNWLREIGNRSVDGGEERRNIPLPIRTGLQHAAWASWTSRFDDRRRSADQLRVVERSHQCWPVNHLRRLVDGCVVEGCVEAAGMLRRTCLTAACS